MTHSCAMLYMCSDGMVSVLCLCVCLRNFVISAAAFHQHSIPQQEFASSIVCISRTRFVHKHTLLYLVLSLNVSARL